MSDLDRRDFIKIAGAGTGAFLAAGKAPAFLKSGRASTNVVVVGAGAFGGWTALNLRRLGAKVTMIDMFGPGKARKPAHLALTGSQIMVINRSFCSSKTLSLTVAKAFRCGNSMCLSHSARLVQFS